jgi:hypothetical protein
LDSVTVEAERCPKSLSGANPWYRIGNGDANPVECLYELLTNAEWGLGRTTGYGSSWAAAAQTVYNESLGFSLVWDSAKSIKEMAQEMLDQVGGIIITDNTTGNWEIKLARADYDPATIPILEAVAPGGTTTGYSCVADIQDYSCGAYDETSGALKVSFTERLTDKNYQTGVAFVYDRANVAIQNQPITVNVNYPGVTDYTVALKLAWRDLVARSIPLKKCKVITDTNGARLKPGDVFTLKWPDYRVNSVVFRVLKVSKPKLNGAQVELDVVQDIFSLGATVFTAPPLGSWVDPIGAPSATATAKLIEQPRHASGDARNIWAAAQKPSGNTNYDLWGSEDNGTNYSLRADGCDFTPVGTLVNSITRGTNAIDTSGQIILTPVAGLNALEAASASEVASGCNIALIEGTTDELISFESFTINGSGQYVLGNVYRGILDTVPNAHTSGVRVWFLHYGAGVPANSNLLNTFDFKTKMVTRSAQGELPLASAAVNSVTLVSRYAKPYPPGNVAFADTSNAGGALPQTDNFDDNSLDLTKWQKYGGAQFNSIEASQQLTNTATATANGAGGLQSISTSLSLSNNVFQVALITAVQVSPHQNWFVAADGSGRYFGFQITPGQINFVHSVLGSTGVTYNATSHKYLRLKYISSTNTLTFETSPDASTWTVQRTITSASTNMTLTALQISLQLIATTPGGSGLSQVWDSFAHLPSAGLSVSGQVHVTWAHRNRLNQPTVIPQSTGDIGPETGATYTVKVYGQSGTLLRTVTGLTSTSYDYTAAFELADTGASVLQTSLTFEIFTLVGGVQSLQIQKFVVTR